MNSETRALRILAVLVVLAMIALLAYANVTKAQEAGCVAPQGARWREPSTGCVMVRPGKSVHLQRATEVDIFSLPRCVPYANGCFPLSRWHLRQVPNPFGEGWAFGHRGHYSAGWDTTNRDVYNYGRHVLVVYWWAS